MKDDIRAEKEKKKEYLNSYKNLCRKLQSLEDQLRSLWEVEQAAKIQQLSDMPKAHKQTDLSDLLVKEEVIFTKIIQKRAECMQKKLKIENKIADMSDGTESLILHKRYIELKPWEQICIEMDYSWKQTHRLHSRALINFKMEA